MCRMTRTFGVFRIACVVGCRMRSPSDCLRRKHYTSELGRISDSLQKQETQCSVRTKRGEYAYEVGTGFGGRSEGEE